MSTSAIFNAVYFPCINLFCSLCYLIWKYPIIYYLFHFNNIHSRLHRCVSCFSFTCTVCIIKCLIPSILQEGIMLHVNTSSVILKSNNEIQQEESAFTISIVIPFFLKYMILNNSTMKKQTDACCGLGVWRN